MFMYIQILYNCSFLMNFGPKLPAKQCPVSPLLTTFGKNAYTALKLMTANADITPECEPHNGEF